jgi:ribonuclease VapC
MVVDTSAIVEFCFGGPRAKAVEETLSGEERLFLSAATALECAIVVARRFGPAGEDKLDELIREAGIEVVPFDAAQLEIARAAYRRFGKGGRHAAQLNYGDCFSYALAKKLGEPLLFVGDDFAQTDIAAALE